MGIYMNHVVPSVPEIRNLTDSRGVSIHTKRPYYAKHIFMVMTSSMTLQDDLKVALHIHV